MDDEPIAKCAEKLAFESQKDAWTAATVARFQHGGVQLKTYKCKTCSLWHLASDYQDK